MLLQAYDDGRYLDPSHHFFHSPIKRRLRMITPSKPPSRLRMALALPVLLAVIALACSKEQSAPTQKTVQIPQEIVVQLKAQKDSVESRVALQYVTVKGVKNAQAPRITIDTLREKVQLDYISSGTDAGNGPSDIKVTLQPPRVVPDGN
jgi:hypothetical protein